MSQDDLTIIGFLFGAISTCIAVFELGLIIAGKKQQKSLQFSLASLSQLSLAKIQATMNQIDRLEKTQNLTIEQVICMYVRTKDDFNEIHVSASALEGAVDSKNFASTKILEKTLKNSKLNNKIQAEGLLNPTLENEENT